MISKELIPSYFFFFGNLGHIDHFWTSVNLTDKRPHFFFFFFFFARASAALPSGGILRVMNTFISLTCQRPHFYVNIQGEADYPDQAQNSLNIHS